MSRTMTESAATGVCTSAVVNDCDLFLYKLVDRYLKSKKYSTNKLESYVGRQIEKHSNLCICNSQSSIDIFVNAISVQLERDEELHSRHFSSFGNVFDANFPVNKYRLYLFGLFSVNPSPNSSPNHSKKFGGNKKLHGDLIFTFLVVVCNVSERIFALPDSEHSLSEKEDVVISCIHTSNNFKNSLLVPDWLNSHGGWIALAQVAERISSGENDSSGKSWFRNTLPTAVALTGLGILGMAALAKR